MSEGTDWLGKCERLLLSATLLMGGGDHDSAVSTLVLPAPLHRYLIDAADARVSGDYEVTSGLTEQDAGRHIQHAEEFVAVAGYCLVASGTLSG